MSMPDDTVEKIPNGPGAAAILGPVSAPPPLAFWRSPRKHPSRLPAC